MFPVLQLLNYDIIAGAPPVQPLGRLLARMASRTKNGRLWTPKFQGKREIIFNDFPKYINISETK